MKLTGVYDNTARRKELRSGWGFSLLVETGSKRILFDTGADLAVLRHNLKELAIPPSSLDGIVLSHPHCDHVGGLSAVLKKNPDLTVVFTESFPASTNQKIESYGAKAVSSREPRELCENIWTTGELTVSYRNRELPEQGLILESSRGPVLVSGCAHPGITEMVLRVKEVTGIAPYLVIGGFHLGSKSTAELRRVVNELKGSVSQLAPTHCTGNEAIRYIRKVFGEDCLDFGAGAQIEI